MAFDAFISYSSLDKPTADAACAMLESLGIRCWIAPRDVMPGREYGASIVDAIHQSRVMVLVFSSHANQSPQVGREVERAVNKGIPIVPLRIENITPTQSLEYFIGTVHWLDALTPPVESHLHRLGEAVQALLRIEVAVRWRSRCTARASVPDRRGSDPGRSTMVAAQPDRDRYRRRTAVLSSPSRAPGI